MKSPFSKKTAIVQTEPVEATPSHAETVAARTAELAAARTVHETAKEAEEAARAKFYDQGDEFSKRALRAARDTAADAAEDVGRAEHLLGIAEQAKAAADLAAAKARMAELEKELEYHSMRAACAPLAKEEVDAIIHLVDVRLKRREHAGVFGKKVSELHAAMVACGLEPSEPLLAGHQVSFAEGRNVHFADGPALVQELLAAALGQLAPGDPRWVLAREIFNPNPTRI